MISVVCVSVGRKFSPKYVQILKAMIARNTTIEHEFFCLSDRNVPGVKTKIVPPGYVGWWNKLQLFNPVYNFQSRVVYFDLDTVICNNIDWLLQYNKNNFLAIEDVGSVNEHQPYLKNKLQSAVMSFDPKNYFHVWSDFIMRYEYIVKYYRGDGEYLNGIIKDRRLIQKIFPNQLKSYKYQVYPNNIQDCSIICFHGRPSIEQAMVERVENNRDGQIIYYDPQPWIKDYWRE